MAALEVGFKNGDVQRWALHEAFKLPGLVKTLTRTTGAVGHVVSFGARPEDEDAGSPDYDFVGLAMGEVMWWRVIGMYDTAAGAALAAELQALDGNT